MLWQHFARIGRLIKKLQPTNQIENFIDDEIVIEKLRRELLAGIQDYCQQRETTMALRRTTQQQQQNDFSFDRTCENTMFNASTTFALTDKHSWWERCFVCHSFFFFFFFFTVFDYFLQLSSLVFHKTLSTWISCICYISDLRENKIVIMTSLTTALSLSVVVLYVSHSLLHSHLSSFPLTSCIFVIQMLLLFFIAILIWLEASGTIRIVFSCDGTFCCCCLVFRTTCVPHISSCAFAGLFLAIFSCLVFALSISLASKSLGIRFLFGTRNLVFLLLWL